MQQGPIARLTCAVDGREELVGTRFAGRFEARQEFYASLCRLAQGDFAQPGFNLRCNHGPMVLTEQLIDTLARAIQHVRRAAIAAAVDDR